MNYLISLLFYLGIVTIKRVQLSRYIFEPPNFVITQLYFTYFQQIVLRQVACAPRPAHRRPCSKLAQENEIAPRIQAVEAILLQLSNRDAVGFDEKYVKAVFAPFGFSIQHKSTRFTANMKPTAAMWTCFLPAARRYTPTISLSSSSKYLKQQEAGQLEVVKNQVWPNCKTICAMKDCTCWPEQYVTERR